MEELLNADDHKNVVSSVLSHLTREEVISLGEALGLKKKTMQPMSKMPDDMVEAWLKMKDDVYDQDGEPTWNSLVGGLRKVNQNSLANRIIEAKGPPPNLTKRQPSGNDHVDTDIQGGESASGEKRVEDDNKMVDWVKDKLGMTTLRQDSVPHDSKSKQSSESDMSRIETEEFSEATSDRGSHKPQLRLHDSDKEFTVIPPAVCDSEPVSRRGFYKMSSERHGVALIINNKDFLSSEHKSRRGTDRDEYNLSETWQFLGYHVIILRNYSQRNIARKLNEIDNLLKEAQKLEKVANDSFVCCILSHGKEGEVYGSDSKPLKYTDLQRFLRTSKILRGKPKILIIQACQGSRQGSKPIDDSMYPKEVGADGGTISEYTDFYLSCASVDGDRSYRDIYTGTWFITELCRTLCEFATVMDLDEIQKEVNERVVKKYNFIGYKQQPRGIDQLRWKVFFFQKDKN